MVYMISSILHIVDILLQGDTLANSNFKPVWIKKETKEDLEKIKVLLGFNDYDSLIKAFIIDKIDIDVKIKSNILKKELC